MADEKTQDFLEMSDEDFLKQEYPPAIEDDEEDKEEQQEPSSGSEEQAEPQEEEDNTPQTNENAPEEASTGSEGVYTNQPSDEPVDNSDGSEDGSTSTNEDNSDRIKSADEYKAFYDQVMAPFKANGKMITARSVDDVIKLMQMGANYARKMQDLAGSRKLLIMLERNGLLDEDRLDFLIALHNKEPEAIKKYFKDNDLDPVDYYADSEPAYQAGSHRVNEAEYRFTTVCQELAELDRGGEVLQYLSTWDTESTRMLWERPDQMRLLYDHYCNGTLKRVMDEVDHFEAVGQIPAGTPKLQSYIQVYDWMDSQGAFKKPAPMARKAVPNTSVQNNKAKAAGTNRTSGNSKKIINFADMSDEDFLKEFGNQF